MWAPFTTIRHLLCFFFGIVTLPHLLYVFARICICDPPQVIYICTLCVRTLAKCIPKFRSLVTKIDICVKSITWTTLRVAWHHLWCKLFSSETRKVHQPPNHFAVWCWCRSFYGKVQNERVTNKWEEGRRLALPSDSGNRCQTAKIPNIVLHTNT